MELNAERVLMLCVQQATWPSSFADAVTASSASLRGQAGRGVGVCGARQERSGNRAPLGAGKRKGPGLDRT